MRKRKKISSNYYFRIKKNTIVLFSVIVVITIVIILILSTIPVNSSLIFEIDASQLAFSFCGENSDSDYVQVFSSTAQEIAFRYFHPVKFDITKYRKTGTQDWIDYDGSVTIYPHETQGKLIFSSPQRDLCLSELFVANNSKIVLSLNENVLTFDAKENFRKIVSVLSIGQVLSVHLENCKIVNDQGSAIFGISDFKNEKLELVISDLMPNVEFKSNSDRLFMSLTRFKNDSNEFLELTRNIRITELEFLKKVITANNEINYESSILTGFIIYPGQAPQKIQINKGEKISYKTKELLLNVIFMKDDVLKINLNARDATSFKIIMDNGDREIVQNALQWIQKRPEISICYTIAMVVFSILGLIKKKKP